MELWAETIGAARTVAGHQARGYHLVEVWCVPCERETVVSVLDLPPRTRIDEVCRRYRCKDCGGRDLRSVTSISERRAFEDAGFPDGPP